MEPTPQESSVDRIRQAVRECGETGCAALLITDHGAFAGRRRYTLEVVSVRNGRPAVTAWLNRRMQLAFGYDLDVHDFVLVDGHGFNAAYELALTIALICGHPVQCIGAYVGTAQAEVEVCRG